MLKSEIKEELEQTIKDLGYNPVDILVSISPNSDFGDYCSNVALQLAKQDINSGNQSAGEIAKEIVSDLGNLSYLAKTEVADNGFINFFVKPEALAADLAEILDSGKTFGSNNLGKAQKIQVEFISANPTGPLTLANGRGGALGDALANVLIYSGYEVEREYYLNDTGNQVRLLGASIKARLGLIESAENHYQGEYVAELAEKLQTENLSELELGQRAADYLMETEIKPAIAKFGVKFDHFFSERSLHTPEKIKEIVGQFKSKDAVYEKDGAWWFKGTEYGDSEDRVLITSEQSRGSQDPTYFLIDVAYHLDVYERGFNKKINLWGADHHGYQSRVQAALKALGFEGKLEVIFLQFVRLIKDGREVRMSKRAGNFVTLDELLSEIPADVARFFFLMYAPSSHINFNLDLAKERSEKNPVYFVQYAHARLSGILEKAEGKEGSGEKGGLGGLTHPTETALIKQLLEFPGLIEGIAQSYQVHHLTSYAITLADHFHRFYEACRVLDGSDPKLVQARLQLVRATQIVLAQSLKLMGVSAPSSM